MFSQSVFHCQKSKPAYNNTLQETFLQDSIPNYVLGTLLLVHFCQMTYSIYEEIAPKKALLKIKVITFSAGGQIGCVTKITQTVTQTHPSWVGWSIGLNRCFGFLEIVICRELNSHMKTVQTCLSNSPLSSTK